MSRIRFIAEVVGDAEAGRPAGCGGRLFSPLHRSRQRCWCLWNQQVWVVFSTSSRLPPTTVPEVSRLMAADTDGFYLYLDTGCLSFQVGKDARDCNALTASHTRLPMW